MNHRRILQFVSAIKGLEHLPIGVRNGPWLAALVAGSAGLPALCVQFLSDDWANLAAPTDSMLGRTPYGYYRPLFMGTIFLDRALWGLSSGMFHLTNLVLIMACAALVVVLVRRYVDDAILAGLTGILFALHPYHIENVAWVAGRSDSLFTLCFLAAALAYDRWRLTLVRLPIGALVLFEAALMSKETAIVLPAFLVAVGLLVQTRRPGVREWIRGLTPVMGVGLIHFVWLRPHSLAGSGSNVIHGLGIAPALNLLGYAAAAMLPAQIEILEARPVVWGCAAVLTAAVISGCALLRSRKIPPTACIAALVALILVAPSLIRFEERYFLLPSAASALVLVALLRAMGRRPALAVGALLTLGWVVASADQWIGWREAGLASSRLVDDLVQASRQQRVKTIVVVNMPRRVRGMPVGIEFDAAVAVSGGIPVRVEFVTYLDYPTARTDDLDTPPNHSIRDDRLCAEVNLRIPKRLYSRYVYPIPAQADQTLETAYGRIILVGDGLAHVSICPSSDMGLTTYVWQDGRLEALF